MMPDQSSTDADRDYREIVSYFETGQYDKMRSAAQRLVDSFPEHGKGWHMLGLACLIEGEPGIGLSAMLSASRLQPKNPEVWDHLGSAYNMLGRCEEAQPAFEKSVSLDPARAETWVNLGKNQNDLHQWEKAVESYRTAIQCNPGLADAHNNLSVTYFELNRPEDALAASDAALALDPDLASAHVHRGNALRALGRISDAVAATQRAIALEPSDPRAWNNLANVLQDADENKAAIEAGERALSLAPDSPEVLSNLGTLYAEGRRPEDAERVLRRAVEIWPEFIDAWFNLGNALVGVEEKIVALTRTLELKPDFEQALSNLIFNYFYLPTITSEQLFSASKRYGELLSRRVEARTSWSNTPDPERPLRVGVVSADFCVHPAAFFFEGPMIAAQKQGIDWFAYSNNKKDDETTDRLKALFSGWHDIRHLSDEMVCEQILADGIDILIDLSGHTAGHRLPIFAAKPAPVQVTWLGYWATTGLTQIDYILTDPWCAPKDTPEQFTEKIWPLPESRFCFTPPMLDLPVGSPPVLANGYVTLGSFNNLNKIHAGTVALWAKVLDAIPGARLLIKTGQLDEERVQAELADRFAAEGIARDRLILEGHSSREEYLKTYNRIDFCLDTSPYSGGTTTAEALWMGVPTLTMTGATLLSRQGESMMRNVGLHEWVASDQEDYVKRATKLAADFDQLSRIRKTMRDRGAASPLGNPVWFSNQLIKGLRGMWRAWCGKTG